MFLAVRFYFFRTLNLLKRLEAQNFKSVSNQQTKKKLVWTNREARPEVAKYENYRVRS